jgi:ribokinase
MRNRTLALTHPGARILVVGGLNTDIVAAGVEALLGPGELSRSGELFIGPGGKSSNIARMCACLLGPDRVFMVGRTSRDPYGLWDVPVKALREAGVNTDNVAIEDMEQSGKFPGIALIPVNRSGENQIYCIPGINDDFSPADLDRAAPLFVTSAHSGILALTLEMPLETVAHAILKAREHGIRVVLDPGGIHKAQEARPLLHEGIHCIKPNEHEARILTGVEVVDFPSAQKAAERLLGRGIRNVMITHGSEGAYLFNRKKAEHFPVPAVMETGEMDETGCGDQATAVLCAEMLKGSTIEQAARLAVCAGTLQFQKRGIQPVRSEEMEGIS